MRFELRPERGRRLEGLSRGAPRSTTFAAGIANEPDVPLPPPGLGRAVVDRERVLRRARDEEGVVSVLFSILLALVLAIGSIVITTGSWFTHAKHLQTKVDAAVFAGGGMWSFPCAPETDIRIRDTTRLYVGDHTTAGGTRVNGSYNPQVGGVEGDQIFVSMNQSQWWDDGFASSDFTDPAGSLCESKTLDVKATENDSPLLWGWLPFLPDIKRKARVEIQQAHGLNEILPIAVRVPLPVSAAAVFYNESNGDLLAVRYFEESSTISGLPGGLHGFTTLDEDDLFDSWAGIPNLPSRTGIAVALSFRPACGTPDTVPPCFEDEGFSTVGSLCNQGSGTQVVDCFYGTGNWPSQSLEAGLHFIRGYPQGTVGGGPPELRGAYLENSSCESNGYFNSTPVGTCQARLSVQVDLGSVVENVGGGGDDDDDDDDGGGGLQQTRKAGNVEVRYRLVRSDGTTFCNYGANCELHASNPGATGTVTYSTQGNSDSPHPRLAAGTRANAIAIQVRVQGSSVTPNPGRCGTTFSFNDNCRWFYLGSGNFGPSVPPTDTQILASPVQRAFMGNIDLSGPVKWLRVVQDENCDLVGDWTDGRAATRAASACGKFAVEMGLKGGTARDQDEPPFAFTEGTGESQMGSVDCDPTIPQGQVLEDGIVNGCAPDYAFNEFNSDPLCPDQGGFFTLPKGPPFEDWPPYDCVKTRPTGSMNQLLTGLNLRIFGVKTNPRCPDDDPDEYVRGRNYWHRLNNDYDGVNFAWDKDTPANEDDDLAAKILENDPRLVRLFFTPYDSFTESGQETFPVVAIGVFYVTGYGRLNGSGGWQGGGPEDPCGEGNNGDLYDGSGNEPPPDLNVSGANSSGVVVWGHFVKYVPANSSTTGGTGDPCRTGPGDFHPCVAVLVE